MAVCCRMEVLFSQTDPGVAQATHNLNLNLPEWGHGENNPVLSIT